MSDGYIVIRNWESFQHYKDAWPVWIKWYTGLLHDPKFTALPMGTRGVFAHLLLLYAGCRGELPRNTRWISRQINGHVTREQLESLNQAGFIEFKSRPRLEHVKRASSPRALAREELSKDSSSKRVAPRRQEGGGRSHKKSQPQYPPGHDEHGPTYPRYHGPRWPRTPMPWDPTPEVLAEIERERVMKENGTW